MGENNIQLLCECTRVINVVEMLFFLAPCRAVSIDFFKMRVNGKKLRVRRLDDGNTKWIWYCTLGSKWIKYGDKVGDVSTKASVFSVYVHLLCL